MSVPENSGIEDIIYPYVSRLIREAETIFDLDPSFSEAEIFQTLTKNTVHFLKAEIVSIWLFENEWQFMASFGCQESPFNDRKSAELFDKSFSDEVVRIRRPLLIRDIWEEERWQNKEALRQFGVNSLLLVPISFPRFSGQDADQGGVLQVFYKERGKEFSSLEIEVAELFSRRVSYVHARKKVKVLQKSSSIKDRIVEHIFCRLTKGDGIFLRDLFNSVIPELSEIMNIQRCALFSVNQQQKEVVLEADIRRERGRPLLLQFC